MLKNKRYVQENITLKKYFNGGNNKCLAYFFKYVSISMLLTNIRHKNVEFIFYINF